MLDNSRFSEYELKILSSLSYEDRIKLFDSKCTGCPYARYSTKKYSYIERHYITLDEAINSLPNNTLASIRRHCIFNEGFTLIEITNNTCKFWYKGEL